MKIILALALLSNLLFFLVFGPPTYRYWREQRRSIVGSPPLRYRFRQWYKKRRADLRGAALVALIIFCYWPFSFAL